MVREQQRLEWIDSIRGIAAILVVIYHLWEIYRGGNPGTLHGGELLFDVLFYQTFDLGKIGVVLFFAISGFVIPFSLFKYERLHIVSFGISRVFRLYPLYWLSILFAIIILPHGQGLSDILINMSMLQKFAGRNDLLGVYWTLQIELIFYVICGVLFLFGWLNRERKLIQFFYVFLIMAYLMAAARYMTDIKLPVALPLSLCVMFFGMLWRKAFDRDDRTSRKDCLKHALIFLVSIIPISMLAYNKDYGFNEVWYRYAITYFTAIILFILLTTVYKIRSKAFIYLGKISYSIYLLHPIFALQTYKLLSGTALGKNPYLLIFVSVLAVVGVSTITYKWVERPAVAGGKRLVSAIQRHKEVTLRSEQIKL